MSSALVWFRRDLRCFDHAALSHALAQFSAVHCVFVFDTDILQALPRGPERRLSFIRESLVELDAGLAALGAEAGVEGAGLIVLHGRAEDEIPALAVRLGVAAVLTHRDHEPAALARDARVLEALTAAGVAFRSFKDQVVFDTDEVLTRDGRPFSVFTPYRNAWRRRLQADDLKPWPVAAQAARLAPRALQTGVPALPDLGFEAVDLVAARLPAGMSGGRALSDDFFRRIAPYREARDYPAVRGVSYLSVHLRFGTVSVRELLGRALADGSDGAQCWVDELIWREFYQMILWHHPRVVAQCFRPEYERVQWEDAPQLLAAWQAGMTGYPIVDAGMRQLARSGYMHNRLRMITASFLTKDLGVDWRLGERHFAVLLNDYDLAANNGGWQWAASTGCDAQPYFRIFNPVTQSERFDPKGSFIRRYLPELARVPDKYIHAPWKMGAAEQAAAGVRIGRDYPAPLVDHAEARERTLRRFGVVKTA